MGCEILMYTIMASGIVGLVLYMLYILYKDSTWGCTPRRKEMSMTVITVHAPNLYRVHYEYEDGTSESVYRVSTNSLEAMEEHLECNYHPDYSHNKYRSGKDSNGYIRYRRVVRFRVEKLEAE